MYIKCNNIPIRRITIWYLFQDKTTPLFLDHTKKDNRNKIFNLIPYKQFYQKLKPSIKNFHIKLNSSKPRKFNTERKNPSETIDPRTKHKTTHQKTPTHTCPPLKTPRLPLKSSPLICGLAQPPERDSSRFTSTFERKSRGSWSTDLCRRKFGVGESQGD